jgi:hypothetical protein
MSFTVQEARAAFVFTNRFTLAALESSSKQQCLLEQNSGRMRRPRPERVQVRMSQGDKQNARKEIPERINQTG